MAPLASEGLAAMADDKTNKKPGSLNQFLRLKAPVFEYRYPDDFPDAEEIAVEAARLKANRQLERKRVRSYDERKAARIEWFWQLVAAAAMAIGRAGAGQKWGANRRRGTLLDFGLKAARAIGIARQSFDKLADSAEWRPLDGRLFEQADIPPDRTKPAAATIKVTAGDGRKPPSAAASFPGIEEGAMDGLPELPPRFQNAFVAAKAKADLEYANRDPLFAYSPLPKLNRIQTVFSAFCTEARNACRGGYWSVAKVSQSVDTAWPVICDYYFIRDHGTSSVKEKSTFRATIRPTVEDDARWKQHLSELAALADAAATVSFATRTSGANLGRHLLPGITKEATHRPSRDQIAEFAKGRFALVHDDLLAEYEKKRTQLLRQVKRTGNSGGYVPALIRWGSERLRRTVLALADAYVDEFTRYDVPSDIQAEKDLQTTAQQAAAGTISGTRGQLELTAKRTRMPLIDPGGALDREIHSAMKAALKEGVLNLRQLVKSKAPENRLQQMDVSSKPAPAVEADISSHLKVDPNPLSEKSSATPSRKRLGHPDVNLLLKVIAKKTISIDTWARDHYIGRTTLFDWKAARIAGKAMKGKVSPSKIAAIEKAIRDDAKALGLATRTRSD